MYWEKCKLTFLKSSEGDYVKLYATELQHGVPYWVYIKQSDFDKLNERRPIHQALRNYPIAIREFLLSGLTPLTGSILPFEREIIHNAYVTNAVANSVAFYAMAYLNNRGLTLKEIYKLRQKYSMENLGQCYFTIDELRKSFESQSVFFLNLYKEMNENDQFEQFAKNLEQENRFKEVFKNYRDLDSLRKHYERKIFHDKLECKFMHSDYIEEDFHPNTGVFAEKNTTKPFYLIDKRYLKEIGMRVCKICALS